MTPITSAEKPAHEVPGPRATTVHGSAAGWRKWSECIFLCGSTSGNPAGSVPSNDGMIFRQLIHPKRLSQALGRPALRNSLSRSLSK